MSRSCTRNFTVFHASGQAGSTFPSNISALFPWAHNAKYLKRHCSYCVYSSRDRSFDPTLIGVTGWKSTDEVSFKWISWSHTECQVSVFPLNSMTSAWWEGIQFPKYYKPYVATMPAFQWFSEWRGHYESSRYNWQKCTHFIVQLFLFLNAGDTVGADLLMHKN